MSTKCFHMRCFISCTLRFVDGIWYLEAIIPIPDLLIQVSVRMITVSRDTVFFSDQLCMTQVDSGINT